MKYKKSQGMPLNIVIIAAVLLVVLIVLILIFTGRMGVWSKGVEEVSEKYTEPGKAGASLGEGYGTSEVGGELVSKDIEGHNGRISGVTVTQGE